MEEKNGLKVAKNQKSTKYSAHLIYIQIINTDQMFNVYLTQTR